MASTEDSLAAAELFILGLEVELGKPVKTRRKAEKRKASEGRKETSCMHSEGENGSEEEGSEGAWFSLERVLDLIVGVSLV
jgi:hypothetical protein